MTIKQAAKTAMIRIINEIADTLRLSIQTGIVLGIIACAVWAFVEGWRNM
jgi:hypothetical protein